MSSVTLINVTGKDAKDVTSALTRILSSYDVNILDIGQSVIHQHLSLGLLIATQEQKNVTADFPGALFSDLSDKAAALGLNISFTEIAEEDYESWVLQQGKAKHIVTLLGEKITARHLARVTEVVAEHHFNIEEISRLSGRISLASAQKPRAASVQLTLSGDVSDISVMHANFLTLSHELDIDIAIQEDGLYRRNRRLVCFDMDSTLIQVEVIDELAKAAGVGEQVAAITESAMRGEIDFSESFRQRMALLEGMDESVLQKIAESLPITDGAARLIKHLRHFGYKVAILSGGFNYFANYLKEKLGIDYVYANQLDFENGKLTGKVKGDIVDGNMKAKLLSKLASDLGISTEQVIAVGDGANDLPMLALAGLGIAFQAKPIVKEQAQHSINKLGLDAILYLLGMRDRELLALENSNN